MLGTRAFFTIGVISSALILGGWGGRGHQSSNRAAVLAIPPDGPVFLKQYEDWITKTAIVPDTWRSDSEAYLKAEEDPNHNWFVGQFDFMESIPRSRYEFLLRLYDQNRRIREKDPARAALTNARGTGTLPYAAIETYDRMQAAMRLYRRALATDSPESKQNAEYLARDIAFYMGWLGHYTADGSEPLHNTIHWNGWKGPNPKGYSTDRHIHGGFESRFVDLIQITSDDLTPLIGKPKVFDDPFLAILAHLADARTHVEEVYQLDKEGALTDKTNEPAARLVRTQLAKGAALLRDLTYTAWIATAKPPAISEEQKNPTSLSNPRYNVETGTAPAGPPVGKSLQ